MEVLELVLRRDGTVKSFKSDFKIYRGSYGDVLFNISVPHELLVDQVRDIDTGEIITGNYVAVSAIIRTVVGKNLQTKKYYFKAVKDYEVHGTTHRLYQRKLPKEFTLWETVNQHEAVGGGLLEMVLNVVNFTTNAENARIEEIVASPILKLDIHASDYLEEEEEIEPSEFEALHSQVEDLQLGYTGTHASADIALAKATAAESNSTTALSAAVDAKQTADGIDYKATTALDIADNLDSKITDAQYASYEAADLAAAAKQESGVARIYSEQARDMAEQSNIQSSNAEAVANIAKETANETKARVEDISQEAQEAHSMAMSARDTVDMLEGEVQQVNSELSNVKWDVDALQGNLLNVESNLGSQINNLETNISGLEGQVWDANNGVANLEYEINTTKDKVYTLELDVTDMYGTISTAQSVADEAKSIASGASRSKALENETEMYAYISNTSNKSKHNVGDSIYLKAQDVPDYWISNILETSNEEGHWAELEPLESKLPDITNMATIDTEQTVSGAKNFTGELKKNNVDVAVITDIPTKTDDISDTNQTNKFVTTAEKSIWNAKSDFDGNYNNLTDKPTKTSDFENDGDGTSNFATTSQLPNVQQTTGQSTTAVMSQKAVSDELGGILNGVDMLIDPDKTYLVIKTPADFDEFTLLTGGTGNPDYTIEWGDGSSEDVVDTSNPTHIYEKAGMYLITISGDFANGINVGSSGNENKDKMIEVYGGTNYPISIHHIAFYECSRLTTASFPRVTSVGVIAFQNCPRLTTADFPNATNIEQAAFYNCSSLTTANFPGVTSISDYAFKECYSLTTATFPSVTSIGIEAFRDCTNLTTADFQKVTSIDVDAFRGCTNLKTLTLGNVTTTDTGTRFTDVKLDNLTISGNVTDTDITRIKTFFTDNGGSFSQSCEIKYGLQVEKTPVLDNDAVRKIDLDSAIQTAIYDSWGGSY